MSYFAELGEDVITATVTLSSGAGTATFAAIYPEPRAVKGLYVTNAGGATTAGATFALDQTGLDDAVAWTIPNGYTQDATVFKTSDGVGPSTYPAGAAGPLPATGAITSNRQILLPGVPINIEVASGHTSDVLTFALVTVGGGNLDNQV